MSPLLAIITCTEQVSKTSRLSDTSEGKTAQIFGWESSEGAHFKHNVRRANRPGPFLIQEGVRWAYIISKSKLSVAFL